MPIDVAPEVEDGPETVQHLELVDHHFTVEGNYAGWRLDRYLGEKLRRLSRTRVQRVIERSLVSERPLKSSTLVWPGLTFTLRRALPTEPTVPGPEQLREVHLDAALLVLDKPAGLPVHPTARYHHGTLLGHLKQKYGPDFEAAPAHRLDRETSGLIVCGRTLEANQRLMRAFVSGAVKKEYLAVVEGWPADDTFEVDAPIAEGTELIRIAVRIDPRHGKPARTTFRVERRFTLGVERFTVLRCLPHTGRQHQIRVHAQLAGFHLVGDKMYGPDPGYFDRFTKRTLEPEAWARLRLPRHALHAAALTLPHPTDGQPAQFSSPLAADLQQFCAPQAAPGVPDDPERLAAERKRRVGHQNPINMK